MSVTVRLEDDLDVSRGDMIARVRNAPTPSQDIDAMVCWMTNEPLRPRQKLAIKHTTRTGRALVKDVHYQIGSAPARERVCQYVYISVVDVSFKNKARY